MRDGNEIVALLGKLSDDPEVEEVLDQFGIRWAPELEIDETEEDEDVVPVWWVWRPSSAHGIEFGFVDAAYLRAEDPFLRGSSGLVLASVCFYGDHEGVRPHDGPLPYGLLLDDSRAAVRHKLGVLESPPRSHRRDTWDPPPYRIVTEHTQRDVVDNVLFKLRLEPWPPLEEPLKLPTIDQIVSLFGVAWHSPAMRLMFFPLGLEACGRDIASHRYADMRLQCGVEMYFLRDPARGADSPLRDKGAIFAGMKFHRSRYADAREWEGELPCGLAYEMAFPTIRDTVGRAPDAGRDESLSGFAVWNFPDYTLHVLYDNIDNVIDAASIWRPGALRLMVP